MTFGSRVVKDSENHLPINYLKAAAVVEGLNDNYVLLARRDITIYCDNKPCVDKAKIQPAKS